MLFSNEITMNLKASPSFNMRDYQNEAINKIENEFQTLNKTILILPTGCGKTVVFAELIRRFLEQNKRCLVIAHREELLDQARSKIHSHTGIYPELDKASTFADTSAKVIVSSIQTLSEKRLERYSNIDLMVIDEAHHVTKGSMYERVINRFPNTKVLGVTATPDRADNKGLGDIFESVSYQYALIEAIKKEYLANIRGNRITDFSVDLSGLRTVNGDFNAGDLDTVLTNYIIPIADVCLDPKIVNLKSICFMPSVQSARLLSEALNERGIKSGFVDGDQRNKDERKRVLSRFAHNEISHLVNCGVLTEGYDQPDIQHILIGRPTKSRSLYSQIVGRGTRPHPYKLKDENGKPYVLLTELSYDTNGKHKLVNAYELFSSSEYDEKTREIVEKKKLEKDVDFLFELEKAHEERFNKQKIKERLKVVNKYNQTEYDPFAIFDALHESLSDEIIVKFEGRDLQGKITEKQKKLLSDLRINEEILETLSKSQASRLISRIIEASNQAGSKRWDIRYLVDKI